MTKKLGFLVVVLLFVNFQSCKESDRFYDKVEEKLTAGTAAAAPEQYSISAYDDIMIEVGEAEGHDWRMIAAIAWCESRFSHEAVSNRGAKGLMQIMPIVARQFGVPVEEIADPETNVMLAAKLMNKLDKMLKLDSGTPYIERMKFILASYNSGIGHVNDARRLAAKYGADPDSWDDVARYIKLKSDPQFARDEVVKHGVLKGGNGVVTFVDRVVGQYSSYCDKVPAARRAVAVN